MSNEIHVIAGGYRFAGIGRQVPGDGSSRGVQGFHPVTRGRKDLHGAAERQLIKSDEVSGVDVGAPRIGEHANGERPRGNRKGLGAGHSAARCR